MSTVPIDFLERVSRIMCDTIGVCDGAEQLAAQLYEVMDGQHQALLDIVSIAVPPGSDPMIAVREMQKIALQGLGKDVMGNVIPIFGTYPKTE